MKRQRQIAKQFWLNPKLRKPKGLLIQLLWATCLYGLGAPVVQSEEVRVVVPKSEVTIADSFNIAIVVLQPEGQPSNPKFIEKPEGFTISERPQGTSNENRFGKIKITYTFVATPTQSGIHKLPKASVNIRGRTVESKTQGTITITELQKEDYFFMELDSDRAKVYPHQEFTLTLKIYARRMKESSLKNTPPFSPPISMGGRQFDDYWPRLNIPWIGEKSGFETEEFKTWANSLNPTSQEHKGFPIQGVARGFRGFQYVFSFKKKIENIDPEHAKRADYHVFTLEKKFKALAPGKYTFAPVTARGMVLDDLSARTPKVHEVTAQTEAVQIEVVSVPEEGRPTSYNGAVGKDFKLRATAIPTKVWVGSPMTLKLELSGKGKLETIPPLPINNESKLVKDFRVHELPETGELSENKLTKTFTYGIRPISEAIKEIPALSFSYFNVETEKYETIQSSPIAILVEKGEEVKRENYDLTTSNRQHKSVDRPIYPIYEGPDALLSQTPTALLGPIPLSLILGCPILFFLLLFTVKRKELETQDPNLKRSKTAGKLAKSALNEAVNAFQTNKQAGYQAVSRSLTTFIADRLKLPSAGMTPKDALRAIEEASSSTIEETTLNELKDLLDRCEMASYGALDESQSSQAVIQQAERLLDLLQKELKG